jgi:hypothetical protein
LGPRDLALTNIEAGAASVYHLLAMFLLILVSDSGPNIFTLISSAFKGSFSVIQGRLLL